MDDVTIPVPTERTAEFFSFYAAWLATPAVPATTLPWDSGRAGELDVAGEIWVGLTGDQRALLDAVAASGPIEAQQVAQALKLSGAVAVAQQARAVNAVAARFGRSEVLSLSVQLDALFLQLDPAAAGALLGDPQAKAGPPPAPPRPSRRTS